MEITQIAVAGTVESSDILITVEPTEADEIQISLESITAIHRAAKKDAYDWKDIDSWNA